MFKSFNPRKYATKKANNYHSYDKRLNELCATCGYPYGLHYDVDCPTDTSYGRGRIKDVQCIPYHVPKKVSKKVLQIRAFKQLLNKYDLLELYPKRLKVDGFLVKKTGNGRCKSMNEMYRREPNTWSNSFRWHSEELNLRINELDDIWNEICANRGWN